jgi:hypothetical protein
MRIAANGLVRANLHHVHMVLSCMYTISHFLHTQHSEHDEQNIFNSELVLFCLKRNVSTIQLTDFFAKSDLDKGVLK